MPFIEFNNQLSVNIDFLDEQHKELIKIINALHEAACQEHSEINCKDIIDQLKDYIKYHFATEERLMQKFDYPYTQEHIQEHDDFIAKVLEFQFQLQNEDRDITNDLLAFLKKWLTGHIQGSDKKYSPYLKACEERTGK